MQLSRALLILTFILAAAACTEKGKPYAQHEQDRTPHGGSSVTEVPASQNSRPLEAMSLKDLAAKILNPAFVGSSEAMVSREARDNLIRLNRSILDMPVAEQTSPEFQTLLKDYAQALQTDCGRFATECKGLKFFNRVPSSAQVAKLIAKYNPAMYHKMLFYSLKLKPTGWDAELAEMLLRKPVGADEVQYAQTLQNMLEVDLMSMQKRTGNKTETRRFLESINAWDLTAKREWATSDAGGNALFSMLANTGMLYDEQGGLHPGLQKRIADQSTDPKGYMALQAALSRQKEFSPESVGVKFTPQMDELLYIVDAVYLRKMSYDSGITLFAGSKKTAADLETVTQNYVRIQFVNALLESTKQAKLIFESKVPLKDLLYYSIQESASIERVWAAFNSSVMPLETFAVAAMRERPNSEEAQARLRALFQSINRSISLTSVYPMQLVLFHLLSQKNFEIKFPSGSFYDSSDLIRFMFEERIPTLFRYGDRTIGFNQIELLHAVDMAIRTNLMQAAKIDPDNFIADTVRSLNQPSINKVTQTLNRIYERLDKNATYESFATACEEFKTGRKAPRQIYFGQLRRYPYFGEDMLGSAFTKIDASLSTNTTALMYMDGEFAEMLEITRLDLGNGLRQAEAMLTSYQSYLRQTGASSATIEAKTKRTRAQVQLIKELRAKVLKLSKGWFDQIGFCYWQAVVRDNEVAEQVLAQEIEYLRGIHRKLKRLRDPSITPQETQSIQDSIRLKGLPSGFPGFDQFTGGGFNYSDVDLLIRTTGYLHTLAPAVNAYLGKRLDKDVKIIREAKQTIIPYTDSEDQFLNSALVILFRSGYVSWMQSTGILRSWVDMISSQLSLYRLEHELTGKTDSRAILDIMKMHEAVLKYVEITPLQRSINKVIGRSTKFTARLFDVVLVTIDAKTNLPSSTRGVFEYPFLMAQQEFLGSALKLGAANPETTDARDKVPDPPTTRLTYITAGKLYFSVRANRTRTVIPFSPDLDRYMNASMRSFIQGELDSIHDFNKQGQDYLNLVEARPANDRPRADIDMFLSYSTPLLRPTIIGDWQDKVNRFNQTTGSCFVEKACEQFGENTTGERR